MPSAITTTQKEIQRDVRLHTKPQAIQPATSDKAVAEISKTDGNNQSLAEDLMAHDKNLNRISSELLKKETQKTQQELIINVIAYSCLPQMAHRYLQG